MFYGITGLHGIHVIIGMIMLSVNGIRQGEERVIKDVGNSKVEVKGSVRERGEDMGVIILTYG
jgi:heme/copper-type cytochrome/quinol oxidase subunit 3